MEFIQIFGVAFAVFAIAVAFSKYKQKKLTLKWMAIWSVIWILAIVVAVMPWTTNSAAKLFGIGRGIDVVVYLSIILLFYLLFRLYAKLEDSRKQITTLVREMAKKR